MGAILKSQKGNDTDCFDSAVSNGEKSPVNTHEAGIIGYSKKIDDPAFEKYVGDTRRWPFQFSLILALAAVLGFYFYGENGSQMDNPQAFHIGLVIGGMFILIALLTIAGKRTKRTWDGEVVDKRVIKKRKKKYMDNSHYNAGEYTIYIVYVKDDKGKSHEITAIDDETLFSYYRVGDKVRHHGGLNTYDKSNDEIIFCNACSTLNDIDDDYCFRCGCPLLKGYN
jgi:hypothetical protein